MIYEYTCSCGKKEEKNFPMGKQEDVTCECGKTMERVLHPVSFMLKGEGWGGKSRV